MKNICWILLLGRASTQSRSLKASRMRLNLCYLLLFGFWTKLMEYEPVDESCFIWKFSVDRPKGRRTKFPRSFSLPAVKRRDNTLSRWKTPIDSPALLIYLQTQGKCCANLCCLLAIWLLNMNLKTPNGGDVVTVSLGVANRSASGCRPSWLGGASSAEHRVSSVTGSWGTRL